MSARHGTRQLIVGQALLITPVTLHWLLGLGVGAFVSMFQPWTADGGGGFWLWLYGQLLLGGVGLAALWTAVLREGRDTSRRQRVALVIGLTAGALVAIAGILARFTPASEVGPGVDEALSYGLPLLVAARQVVLLLREGRLARQGEPAPAAG